MTAIRLPEGITAAQFLPKVLEHGVMLAGGLIGNLSYFRIGHMHLSATDTEHIDKALSVVSKVLGEFGYSTFEEGMRFLEVKKDWKPRVSLTKEEL